MDKEERETLGRRRRTGGAGHLEPGQQKLMQRSKQSSGAVGTGGYGSAGLCETWDCIQWRQRNEESEADRTSPTTPAEVANVVMETQGVHGGEVR